jgi:hypothetical protein
VVGGAALNLPEAAIIIGAESSLAALILTIKNNRKDSPNPSETALGTTIAHNRKQKVSTSLM